MARDFGDISQLLPPGVTLKDAPHNVFDFIRQALVFISFEELPKDEQPDKKIWDDPEAIEAHFKEVEKQRKQRTDPKGPGPIEDPVENEAARSMMVG